jgi:mannose-1-phosphate guanylyltransferase
MVKQSITTAFLLAAGKGTRLGELTKKTPKCMVPIKGIPLLGIWLGRCAKYGIKRVIINGHYLNHIVEDYLHNYNENELEIIYVYEKKLLGSGGTVLNNLHFIEDRHESFFVIYVDNLTNLDIRKMSKYHFSHQSLFTIGLFKSLHPSQCGILNINKKMRVLKFVEKPKNPTSNLANAGIYIMNTDVLAPFIPHFESNQELLDFGYHIIPNIIKKMKAYIIQEYFIDIGTPGSYKKANNTWISDS